MQNVTPYITTFITFDIRGYLEKNPGATHVQLPIPFLVLPQIPPQTPTQMTFSPLDITHLSSPSTSLLPLPIPNNDNRIPHKKKKTSER